MAETLKAPPQGLISGKLAELLKSGKESLNKYEVKAWVPLIGGTGVGDIFLGEAPELVEDVSYEGWKGAFKGGNTASGGLGTLTVDPRMLDVGFLGADLIGIGSGLKALGKAGVKKAAQEIAKPTAEGRREFVKKTGAVTAGLTVGAGMLKVMGKVGKEGTKRVVDNAPVAAVKKHKFNSLKEYNDYLDEVSGWKENPSGPTPEAKVEFAKIEEDIYTQVKNLKEKQLAGEKLTAKEVEYLDEMSGVLDEFSPQAKEELAGQKALAKEYRIPWTEYIDVTQPF